MKKRISILCWILVFIACFSLSCLAQIQVDAGEELSVCAAAPGAILGGSPTANNGMAPYTYQWTLLSDLTNCTPFSASQFLSLTNVSNPVMISPDLVDLCDNNSLYFEVLVTDQMGQTARDTQIVHISNIQMGLVISTDTIFSVGQSISLQASPFALGIAPYTYSWSPTNGLDDPTNLSPNASPGVTTFYEFTVTDAAGCSATQMAHEVYVDYIDGLQEISSICALRFPNPISTEIPIFLPQCEAIDSYLLVDVQGRILGGFEGGEKLNTTSLSGMIWLLGIKEDRVIASSKIYLLSK